MAEALPISEAELQLLRSLVRHKVRFMVVGLSAAALQGAPVVTEDIDLWIEDFHSSAFQKALLAVDATYCPPFGSSPPMLAGEGFDQLDLVVTMSGLNGFAEEASHVVDIPLGRLKLPVLSLERIIVSKSAADRDKDRRVLQVLKNTLATIKQSGKTS